MNATETINKTSGLFFNEALFGLAILAFILLVIIEKRHPFRVFPQKFLKSLL